MSEDGRRRELHQQVVVDQLLLDLDERHPQFFGEGFKNFVFVDQPQLNQRSIEPPSRDLRQRRVNLLPGNEAVANQSLCDVHRERRLMAARS